MNELHLSYEELRSLRKMRGRSSVPQNEILHYDFLYKAGLITPNLKDSGSGFTVQVRDGTYCLSDEGLRYLTYKHEQLMQWLVPVLISAAALLISFVALFK